LAPEAITMMLFGLRVMLAATAKIASAGKTLSTIEVPS
jgi:hypothetical protein